MWLSDKLGRTAKELLGDELMVTRNMFYRHPKVAQWNFDLDG